MEIYKKATGWLGWSHSDAMQTHVAFIDLALEGLIDKLEKTNPYAAEEPEDKMTSASDGGGVIRLFRSLAQK